ncbi:hypothetical protein L3Q82_017000 [Scortum barcoo]|uniref:Uncharacterized protein n=1 Tax=Scortum barcoo TaxID=214431 RepID=A0ACB8X8X9_9TELE|nr:hypothetical protein L3Q82_017000 [Scortum barcoo]
MSALFSSSMVHIAQINITTPDGAGPVTHTVSSLTAGAKYTFTFFSVFENVRSSGVNIAAVTAPQNAESFRSIGQNETSITLQWNKVNSNVSFVLQFNGTQINITTPDGDGAVTHTVSSLTAGAKYTFTLFSVFENIRSSGVNIAAVTAPPNPESFLSTGQNETSITLQWNKVNSNVSFILQFNGAQINITTPDGDGPVTHTVSSLTAGTKYTFTLFSVFENVRSSGVNIAAVTAPPNAESFRSIGQNETSITLQWNKVNSNVSFILQFNGTQINITTPDGDGPVTHTVSSLTAGAKYTFTLFSVFENVRSSGVNIAAVTVKDNTDSLISSVLSVFFPLSIFCPFSAPQNTESFRSIGQNETSITLQWNKVNSNVSFILQFSGTQINITTPDGDGAVTHTVSSLTAGAKYTFTLFSLFENVRSSGVNIAAVTAPQNAESFRSIGQNETSITLQWNKVNSNVSFILQFNGTQINITTPDGAGPVTHTVSSLTAGAKYTFTLFSVFENVRSSGVNIAAVTAPQNAESFRSIGQNETSITLQWNKVNSNVSFILQFNGTQINITTPDGDGAVTHTVSSLTAGAKYTFTLFSVFENVRSSGVNIAAVTAPQNAESFRSIGQNETSITLQWNKVNSNVSFILQFNGTQINITTPDGDGPANFRSSGVNIAAVTAPPNAESFRSIGQNETSITLQWNKVNSNVSFILQFNGTQINITTPDGDGALLQMQKAFRSIGQNETSITLQWNKVNSNVSFILQFNGTQINITTPDGDGPVTHTVSSLTAGAKYTFTLFSVFENVRSSGVNIAAVTAPQNTESFRLIGQNETSITLQWNKVNSNVSFILQFNGTQINITTPDGDGAVTHTVSSLTAGAKYTFTLFSVFENVRSTGVNIAAVTAPPNPESFLSTGQNETSITLQWNKVNSNVSFILQFNGTAQINITTPDGDGPVTHTVSSFTAGAKYTFTLFSVFENVRSSGVNIAAVTAPQNTESFRSIGQNETSITLQWNKVNSNVSFILQFNGTQINITTPDGDGPNVRSSGVNIAAVTAPQNAESFRSIGQNDETSITLQWNKVNSNVSFILQFNGTQINITTPDGDGPVTHTVSSLTAGAKYTFTLFSVFENVRSSGVNIAAVTAPQNAESFRSIGQNETSITLQWNKVNSNVSFVLQFNGTQINITTPDGDGALLQNAESFRSIGQNETSITLQWNKVNSNVSFILQFNGTQINITTPDGDGAVTHTVSSLTAGAKYTFTLFSVFENVRSSGVNIAAVTAPQNAESFRSIGQNETSITLQWNKVNSNVSFILQFNGTQINITTPDGDGPAVTHTVSSLTAGAKYTFTFFSVFENVRSSGVNIAAVTAPQNTESFRSIIGQNETSITLQWNKVNSNVSFILQFNGTQINITTPDGDGAVTHTVSSLTAGAKYTFTLFSVFENVRSSGVNIMLQSLINITTPDGDGPVTHTVSSFTAGAKYTFTLFSVFENVRSSGVNIAAVTAPPNAESFRSIGQNETSITLQWNKVNSNVSFILQFNGTQINITTPDGDGPVTHTVSSLTAGAKYTFTLFSVFENIRSSGVNIAAVTAPPNAESFKSIGQNETSITLQWNKVNSNVSFILQFNGTQINITTPDGDGPNVRSSGVNIAAVTAPQNTESFRSIGQNETSITLQWNKVNSNVSFILQFNGTQINITTPDGAGPVTHTVSSLTAGTKYTFTLFSVFENVRSSGVNIAAVTGVVSLDAM